MAKKLQKIYLTYNNLLIVQDVWQSHILSIIFLKEFVEANVNSDVMTKNVKHVELNISCDCFLEYTNFKDDLIVSKCLICNKNCQIKFDEKLKERFFNAYKYLRTLEICVLKYMSLILQNFFQLLD